MKQGVLLGFFGRCFSDGGQMLLLSWLLGSILETTCIVDL
jgi:hypothetical protein